MARGGLQGQDGSRRILLRLGRSAESGTIARGRRGRKCIQ